MIACYADEGKDTGRSLWGSVAVAVDLETRKVGLSFTGLTGLGETKKQDFFFNFHVLSHALLFDLCLRTSVHILICLRY